MDIENVEVAADEQPKWKSILALLRAKRVSLWKRIVKWFDLLKPIAPIVLVMAAIGFVIDQILGPGLHLKVIPWIATMILGGGTVLILGGIFLGMCLMTEYLCSYVPRVLSGRR